MEIDIQYFPLGHSLTHSRVLATTWSRFVRVRTAVSKMSPSWKRFFCLFFLQLDFPLLLVIMLMSLLSRSKKRFAIVVRCLVYTGFHDSGLDTCATTFLFLYYCVTI